MSSSSKALKKKHRKINGILALILMVITVVAVIAMIINIFRVGTRSTASVDTENTNSLSTDTQRDMSNDLYEIGNNPTEYEKECFQKLTDALKSGTKEQQAEALVYAFVSDYFTGTNKDGNYEVGGLQYIYSNKYVSFEEWSRYNYYQDMDLYISQYGRDNLPAVSSITTDVETFKAPDFTVNTVDPAETYDCYQVQVSWTYNMGAKVPKENFVNDMRFQVIDHDGRMEIAEFYDMDSVNAWEAANSVTSTEGQEG